MNNRAVITGFDCTTSFGVGADVFWKNILKNNNGIKVIESFPSKNFPMNIAADLSNETDIPDNFFKDRGLLIPEYKINRCGLYNTFLALEMAGINIDELANKRVGVFISDREMPNIVHYQDALGRILHKINDYSYNLDGRMELFTDLKRYIKFDKKLTPNKLSQLVYESLNIHGPSISIGTACASSNDAVGRAFRAIKHNQIDIAIAGGAYELEWMGMLAFQKLGTLSSGKDPGAASTPFSTERTGFVMGSGAGIIVLENPKTMNEKKIFGEVVGYGNSCDAYRQTDPHPEALGATRAIQNAISEAKLKPIEIDLISSHGTSTYMNDLMETKAIKNVFGEKTPYVNATKSMIGHTIMAAGVIQIIGNIYSMKNNITFPTRSLTEENIDSDCQMNHIINSPLNLSINKTLSNSFGFGGQNSCIITVKN